MTLVEQVAAARRTLHRLMTRRLSRRTERPFMQLLALKVVALEDIRSQAALAERLLVDAPAASRLVERLVKDGLLERTAGADRRCVCLNVTRSGREQVDVLLRELDGLEKQLRGCLTATEAKTLGNLLAKVQERLSAEGDPPEVEQRRAR